MLPPLCIAIVTYHHTIQAFSWKPKPPAPPSIWKAPCTMPCASTRRSMSDIVNDALRAALREDEEDLAAFTERAGEKPVSYERFLAQLKADGTL